MTEVAIKDVHIRFFILADMNITLKHLSTTFFLYNSIRSEDTINDS